MVNISRRHPQQPAQPDLVAEVVKDEKERAKEIREKVNNQCAGPELPSITPPPSLRKRLPAAASDWE